MEQKRNIISLLIKAKPQGKSRSRTVFNGKYIHSYTPKKTKDFENIIKAAFIKKYPNHKIIENTPIAMEIVALYELPKSCPKSHKKFLQENKFIPHLKKPDWDNIGKLVSDALNGVAYRDDALIVDAKVIKSYSAGGDELIITISY